ncbi:MAG: biosynthetic-type acetolactate synthase large subunit [Alphaproteobacteria bacterium]
MSESSQTEALTGAEMIVKTLEDLGVEVIFGYPGGAVLPFYDALFKRKKIKHILVRHEQAATHAAEGYARSTGKTGVVLVTSGPGATNAVTGLTDAMLDSVPIVCLTGQVPSALIGTDAFQEADTTGMTRTCTKQNYLLKNPNDISRTVQEAFYVARTGRPGPVVIDLPKDIQMSIVTEKETPFKGHKSYAPQVKAPKKDIEKMAKMIASASKPVIYGGGGIVNSGEQAGKLVTDFVNEAQIPTTLTLMGLGAVPASNPQFLGMLGMHGTYEANMAMHGADLILCIGARFDDRVTGRIDAFAPHAKIVHIDIDPSSINKNVQVDLPVVGDIESVMTDLKAYWDTAGLKMKDLSKWHTQVDLWREKKCLSYADSKEVIKPQFVLDTLNKKLKDKNVYITTEVGQHQMWAAQYLDFEKPKRWMTSGGLGTMGYGFPSAVGVQVAHPDALVIDVSGEASFLMNMQELSTVKQYNLPVKILILNNQWMGMVRQWQELNHGGRYTESYTEELPDFVKLAETYGLTGLRCTKVEDVAATLDKMMATEGAVIVDMQVNPMENCFPMIPPGKAHNEMIFEKVETSKEGQLLV